MKPNTHITHIYFQNNHIELSPNRSVRFCIYFTNQNPEAEATGFYVYQTDQML